MIETPRALARGYPRARLDAYRWHTGATLRPLEHDEPCPILFRDVGLTATARFLRGALPRLAGPYTPITYMRTWRYEEPYVDHESTGRLAILRPIVLEPWHSGVEHIYVADARCDEGAALVSWVPGGLGLEEAARRLAGVCTRDEASEALGGREYTQRMGEEARRLERVDAELAEIEVLATPLRRALQRRAGPTRDDAERTMARLGVTEHDLCAAWHHVPRARRDALISALRAGVHR